MSSLNDDKMGLLKATSNVLLNYGPSTRGITSKVMLDLAIEMKSRGVGEPVVWDLLRQRMQNPALALASQNEDGGTVAIEKELNTLGIFQENENAIKIIEWPSLIKIPISDKLEIHLDYAKHDNERKLRLLGTGRWKNFK